MLALVKTTEGTLDQLRETNRVKPAVLAILAAQHLGDDPLTTYRLVRVSGVTHFERGKRREFMNPGNDRNCARFVLRAALGRRVAEKQIAQLAEQFVTDELFENIHHGGATAGEVQLWAEGR